MPRLRAALALSLALAAPAARASETGWTDPSPAADATVVFRNNGERARVRVVVADTEAARVRGLGGRGLQPGEGILYDFREQKQVRMWTRDDRVPLDMAFLGEEGVVSLMRKDLPPGSDTPIPSRVPVRYVLEVPAGTLTRLGIAVGDGVELAAADRPAPQAPAAAPPEAAPPSAAPPPQAPAAEAGPEPTGEGEPPPR